MSKKLLSIENLKTRFKIGKNWATAVDGISLDIYKGETLGIVGESGSGKSVSVLSLIQLIPNPPGEVSEGTITFKDKTIFDGNELASIREIPEFKYFNELKGGIRSWVSCGFFFGWLGLHFLLGIPGLLLFILSFFLDLYVSSNLFFASPQKEAMNQYQQSMFQKMRDYRGEEIAMIFQEPMTSLNPVYTIGMQVTEAVKPKLFWEYVKDHILGKGKTIPTISIKNRIQISVISSVIFFLGGQLGAGWTFKFVPSMTSLIYGGLIPVIIAFTYFGLNKLISNEYRSKHEILFQEGVSLLKRVGIPDAEKRMQDYPHQFSGGMRQRVMIAMALAKNPSLLIADEPTTALDVTIQAQILDLMLELKEKNTDAAVVLITHDLAVVAQTCERVIVMYGGEIQEIAAVNDIFKNPLHPYTKGLLNSIPNPDKSQTIKRLDTIPGMVPNILEMPKGCKFCTRCEIREEICDNEEPSLSEISDNHFVRCHFVETSDHESMPAA